MRPIGAMICRGLWPTFGPDVRGRVRVRIYMRKTCIEWHAEPRNVLSFTLFRLRERIRFAVGVVLAFEGIVWRWFP
jgi:hypothetical protein